MPVALTAPARPLKALVACVWASAVVAGAWAGPTWHAADPHPAAAVTSAPTAQAADVPR